MMFRDTFFQNNRGQATIEFVIAIPIVMLLIMGIYEFSRVYYVHTALNGIAQEAARLASLPNQARDSITGNIVDDVFIRNRIIQVADSLNIFDETSPSIYNRSRASIVRPDASLSCRDSTGNNMIIGGTRTYRPSDGVFYTSLGSALETAIVGSNGATNRNEACIYITFNAVDFLFVNSLLRGAGLPPFRITVAATARNQYEN